MTDSVAGVVLAAGAARRLRPISDWWPKPLCPVLHQSLLDRALDRLRPWCGRLAVNVHHHASRIMAAVPDDVHVSHEAEEALGTAGAIGALQPWLAGSHVVIVNGDTYCVGGIAELLDGWSGTTVRVLTRGGEPFGPHCAIAGSLLPDSVAATLAARPTGLYETVWRDAAAAGCLDVVAYDGPLADCGTATRLLDANLEALQLAGPDHAVHPSALVTGSAVGSVVGAGAVVAGVVEQSLLFPGARVEAHERLARAVRLPGATPGSAPVTVYA